MGHMLHLMRRPDCSARHQTIDQRTEPERSRLIDKKYDYLNDVSNFETEGTPLFAPCMKLDQKMRYFWPISKSRNGDDGGGVGSVKKQDLNRCGSPRTKMVIFRAR